MDNKERHQSKIQTPEIKFLRHIKGCIRLDQTWNQDIRNERYAVVSLFTRTQMDSLGLRIQEMKAFVFVCLGNPKICVMSLRRSLNFLGHSRDYKCQCF